MTDILHHLTERELLVKQNTVLHKICLELKDLKKDSKEAHRDININLDKVNYSKVSHKLFFWVSGIIIFCILSLTAYTGVIKNEVVRNTTCIKKMEIQGNK